MNTSHLDQMSDNFKSNLCPLQLKGMETNHRFVADLQNMFFLLFAAFPSFFAGVGSGRFKMDWAFFAVPCLLMMLMMLSGCG